MALTAFVLWVFGVLGSLRFNPAALIFLSMLIIVFVGTTREFGAAIIGMLVFQAGYLAGAFGQVVLARRWPTALAHLRFVSTRDEA